MGRESGPPAGLGLSSKGFSRADEQGSQQPGLARFRSNSWNSDQGRLAKASKMALEGVARRRQRFNKIIIERLVVAAGQSQAN